MTAKIKGFRAFLKTYLEEDSWIGDLARDSFKFSNWTGRTAKSLRRHMETFTPCEETWEALVTITELYKHSQ